MADLIAPHGKQEKLMPLLLAGKELEAETKKSEEPQTHHHHHPGNIRCHHDGNRCLHAADRLHDQGGLEGRLRQVHHGRRHVLADPDHGLHRMTRASRRATTIALDDEETGTTIATMKRDREVHHRQRV